MTKKIAFVSDFDGTITDDDFFNYAVDAFLDDDALQPWRDYRAGLKTHFQALRDIFLEIKVPTQILHDLIQTIKVDKFAPKVWNLCKEKNIPMSICSAGNDYYIKELIGKELKEYNIQLITNTGSYNPEIGLDMEPLARDNEFYDENVGISKVKIIKKLKDEGYFVIFAGDGPPDVEPAMLSDVVFARKYLLSQCQAVGKETMTFNSYDDIYNYLKDL